MSGPRSHFSTKGWRLLLVTLAAGLATAAIASLLISIAGKKSEEQRFPLMVNRLDDSNVDPAAWGVNFPQQYDRFAKMAEPGTASAYGGGEPYSRLIRKPALRRLWAGYPFAADYNAPRSHHWAEVDQIETKRNDRAWLNSHGFPSFTGQPGACINCHSAWAPSLVRELGWETFNHTPYSDLKTKLITAHGEGLHGHALGSACADCHSPKDMRLRVTRPAYIQAMVARGYEADPETGLKATTQAMRSHVCQQCHVEYYLKGDSKVLTFPWTDWPKDEPLRIEMIEAYYDRAAALPEGGFKADWTHQETGASMLKMQHPETELSSSGVHANSGVACADCHMPYRRDGAVKVTDHFIASPMLDVRRSCQTCHAIDAEQLRQRVALIQRRNALQLRTAEGAIVALIDDITTARQLLTDQRRQRQPALNDAAFQTFVDELLAAARKAHRRASMRWDFVASENSGGFHSPQEAARVLGDAAQIARRGQLALVAALAKAGIPFTPTVGDGRIPAPGTPIPESRAPVGSPPPKRLLDLDAEVAAQAGP